MTARDTDQNTIVLNWMPPSDDGGSDIAKYRIVFADNDGVSEIPADLPADAAAAELTGVGAIATKDATTTYTHEELTAGIRYRYQVYAINEADLMSQNAGDTAAETTETLDKPGTPTGLTAVQTDTRIYTLYWYAPAQTGGTDISGYKVEVALQGGSFAVPATGLTMQDDAVDTAQATYGVPTTVDHDGDSGNAEIPVTTVQFRVYSETTDVTKDPEVTLTSTRPDTSKTITLLVDTVTNPTTSMTVTLRTKRIPGRPTFVTDDAKRDGFGNVDLDWNAPATGTDDTPSTVSGYRIDVSDDEGISWRPLPNANNTRKTDTEYTYKDPEKKNRHYRIFAWNGQYLGPAQMVPVQSEPEPSDLGEPDHATGLTVTAVGPSQINVSWTAPENTGGSPIMHYEVHGSLMGSSGFADLPTEAPVTQVPGMLFTTRESTSYSHTGLSAGQTWRYRVVPVNENDDDMDMATAANAEVRQATTHQEEMPEAPEMLVAESAKTSNSNASEELGVLLLWNAPNAPDGADIGGYRIQRMKDGGAWETLASNTNSPHTDFTDSEEPAMGEMRGYQVAAISANNILGAWSNVAMLPQDTSHTPVVGPEVGPATGVTTGPFNAGGTIMVNWDAAPNATGYIIYAVNVDELDDANGQIVVAPVNDAAAETYNLGGLKSGDTYDIYVVATAKEMVAWPASADVKQVPAN